ncbi:MAG: ribosomal protein S18-alanine N-acetyltransferase [Candidatus Adiutrix sp.]|jgi:ribosomal-protein-alanine N-acetyltransferase|nr:ribosomal protein S18-alanine N-acetyltransferase [Candidatus Adiutrix sp.]
MSLAGDSGWGGRAEAAEDRFGPRNAGQVKARLLRLTEADLPEVLALERLVYSQPWTEGNFQGEFRRQITLALGLKRGGRLLAHCFFWLLPPEIHLLNLAVRPECRRLGLAWRLVTAMESIGRRAGARNIFLEVRPSNRAALSLYRSRGFQVAGRRPGYYGDGEDAVLMTLELIE